MRGKWEPLQGPMGTRSLQGDPCSPLQLSQQTSRTPSFGPNDVDTLSGMHRAFCREDCIDTLPGKRMFPASTCILWNAKFLMMLTQEAGNGDHPAVSDCTNSLQEGTCSLPLCLNNDHKFLMMSIQAAKVRRSHSHRGQCIFTAGLGSRHSQTSNDVDTRGKLGEKSKPPAWQFLRTHCSLCVASFDRVEQGDHVQESPQSSNQPAEGKICKVPTFYRHH